MKERSKEVMKGQEEKNGKFGAFDRKQSVTGFGREDFTAEVTEVPQS